MGSKGIERLQRLFSAFTKSGRFDQNFGNVQILSAENGNLSASMKIRKDQTNANGNLHGGMTASLVDCLSGLGLLTYPNIQSSGVSISMNITYLTAASEGEEILINTTSDKVGRKVAFLSVHILNKSSGHLIAQGTHVKYLAVGGVKVKLDEIKKD